MSKTIWGIAMLAAIIGYGVVVSDLWVPTTKQLALIALSAMWFACGAHYRLLNAKEPK